MAVAARPGTSDARVPCPLCGGLVHPIAGKCKHCKADLTSYHPARPAASAPLPPLLASAARTAPPGGSTGYAPPALAATQIAPAAPGPAGPGGSMASAAREAAPPVLPPRPTSYPVEPRPSAWRSWPAVVIVVAILAIIAAVVLMAWPPSRGGFQVDRKSALPPPPAPERMQTEPDIKQPQVAPKAAPKPSPPQAQATPDPWASPPTAPSPRDPDADSPDPDVDTGSQDPMPNTLAPKQGAFVVPPGSSGNATRRKGTAALFAMAAHVCRRMLACGTSDANAAAICDSMSRVAPPAHCAAANRCIARIDAMACGGQPAVLHNITILLTQFPECADALRC